MVVEDIAWSGVQSVARNELGPVATLRRITNIPIVEKRLAPDGSTFYLTDDKFWIPLQCSGDWPDLLFSLHGDPRLGLAAVFGDTSARKGFQESHPAEAARTCVPTTFVRPGEARWVADENVLVLLFGDETFVESVAGWLAGTLNDPIQPLDRAIWRGEEIVSDYLAARAAGRFENAWARLVGTERSSWIDDVEARSEGHALLGSMSATEDLDSAGASALEAWPLADLPE